MMNKAESVKARYGRNAMKKAPNGRGPGGPRGGFRTPGQSIDKGTLKKLIAVVFKPNIFKFIIVTLCILVSALASVESSLFVKSLVDDYINPMITSGSRDFTRADASDREGRHAVRRRYRGVVSVQLHHGGRGTENAQAHPRRHVPQHAAPACEVL